MKKVLPAIMMLLMVFAATAQEMPANPDPALLDLSRAKAAIAGPDKVYVRSLYYDGVEFSIETSAVHAPAPGAVFLGSIGVVVVGWLRRRRASSGIGLSN